MRAHNGDPTVVVADARGWTGLIHQSPAFQEQVEEELAAINVAEDLVALVDRADCPRRNWPIGSASRNRRIAQLESAEPKNVELRTLVRVATALGARLDVSIRPRRKAERKSSRRARVVAKKSTAGRSPA